MSSLHVRHAQSTAILGFKIQNDTTSGWCDVVDEFDEIEVFPTEADAKPELDALVRLHNDPDSWRVVPTTQPAPSWR